jgi:transposase InsO family protein
VCINQQLNQRTRIVVMVASARLLTSVEPDQRERFSELAAAQGVSSSRLLARLVHRALVENPEAKVKRLLEEAAAGKAPAEKYTVRLMGLDAARLEARAQARGVTASGYVAHVLRAHLRADPPMPYREFQELKRVVNELAGIRGAMAQLASREGPTHGLEPSLKENVLKLLPALKQIRDKVQDTLTANSKSWEAPNA